ncbi:glutamate receptor-like [Penaeus japonicus]|uniref:glutamate receptor-like n=1 Tax=Penaeus japonicus TaxID=27405 RepID=UPI001C7172CB|nr:glutamate receptor-like [Penaeus japonicus]
MSGTGGCLRVLILSWGPWVIWDDKKAPSTAVGVLKTLMDIVARKFGICYEVDAPADLDFGSKLDNGSLTGIIGMLNRSEADMSMVPMSVDYFRYQFVEFSEFLIVDEHRMSFKRPTPEADVGGFAAPFTLTMWLALFLSTLLMCTAVFFSECGASFILRSKGKSKQKQGVSGSKLKADGISSQVYHAVLWTVSCLFAQSVPWEPRNVPVRVVAGMWLLATLIVGTVYRSNLKAMLILPKVVLPFDNFEEFAEVDLPGQLILGGVLEVASREADPNSMLAKIRAKSHVDSNIWLAVKEVLAGRFAGIASASGQSWLHHIDFSVPLIATKQITFSLCKSPAWTRSQVVDESSGNGIEESVKVCINNPHHEYNHLHT